MSERATTVSARLRLVEIKFNGEDWSTATLEGPNSAGVVTRRDISTRWLPTDDRLQYYVMAEAYGPAAVFPAIEYDITVSLVPEESPQ